MSPHARDGVVQERTHARARAEAHYQILGGSSGSLMQQLSWTRGCVREGQSRRRLLVHTLVSASKRGVTATSGVVARRAVCRYSGEESTPNFRLQGPELF